MMTDHELVQQDLPAYAASRLEQPALGRLQVHLQSCEECRQQAARFMRLADALQADGDALFEPHPSEAALRDHVAGDAGEEHGRISRHLELCATCSLEAGMWRKQGHGVRVSPERRPRRTRGWTIAVASLAAGLILGAGLSLPIWKSIRATGGGAPYRPTTASREPSAGPQLVLPRVLRGEVPEVAYALDPNRSFVVIACLAAIAPEAPPATAYRYEIRRSTGESVWSADLTAAEIRRHLESTEIVTLLVPANVLAPGRYEFRLAPASRPESVLYAASLTIAVP